jgi:hypothetical protein
MTLLEWRAPVQAVLKFRYRPLTEILGLIPAPDEGFVRKGSDEN